MKATVLFTSLSSRWQVLHEGLLKQLHNPPEPLLPELRVLGPDVRKTSSPPPLGFKRPPGMYCTSTLSRKGQKVYGQAVPYSYRCNGKRADAHKGMNAAAPVGFKHHGYAIRAIVCD
ncbi:hypothetical protein ROHU_025123 [Labeo rohita]|uniref:Uncharacterized protein n=1 Tax=Labeo rohita TaxID=84645 RepID=A0A498MLM0_LABRO|nr:hypothetical protein ROHU_025123 [Labeo rohita]